MNDLEYDNLIESITTDTAKRYLELMSITHRDSDLMTSAFVDHKGHSYFIQLEIRQML